MLDREDFTGLCNEHRQIHDALLANDYWTLIALDKTVEAFLGDDTFWQEELCDDRDIPLQDLLTGDPI